MTWKPPRKDLQFGVIRGYYVGYKPLNDESSKGLSTKLPSTIDFIYKTLEMKNDGLMNEECLLTGLKRATKYQIIVQAFNSKGAGPASEPVNAKTLELGKLMFRFTKYNFNFI